MDNCCELPFQVINGSTTGASETRESSADEFSKLRTCWREVYHPMANHNHNANFVPTFPCTSADSNNTISRSENSSRRRPMTEEQRIKNNLRRRTSEMSEEARLQRNAKRRVGVISEEMRLRQNERRKVGVISEEKRMLQNARRRVGAITEEQRLKQNLRRRVGVISEEQRLKQNIRRRVGVISEEQRLKQNLKRRKVADTNSLRNDSVSISSDEQSTGIDACSFVPHHFLVEDQLAKKKTFLREYYRNRALSEEYRLLKCLKLKKNHSSKIIDSSLLNNINVQKKNSKNNTNSVNSSNSDIIPSIVSNSVTFHCPNAASVNNLTIPTNNSTKECFFNDSCNKFPQTNNLKQLAQAEKHNHNFFLKCVNNECNKTHELIQEKFQNNVVVKTENFENYEKFMRWMEN